MKISKIHKLIISLVFIFMITPAVFAKPVEVNNTGWVPMELFAYNNCNEENVLINALVFTQTQTNVDSSGGVHITLIVRIRGTGTGLTTGAKYLDAGEGYTAVEHFAAASETYVLASQLSGIFISMDESAPNLHYKFRGHTTIDANGNLRTTIDSLEVIC